MKNIRTLKNVETELIELSSLNEVSNEQFNIEFLKIIKTLLDELHTNMTLDIFKNDLLDFYTFLEEETSEELYSYAEDDLLEMATDLYELYYRRISDAIMLYDSSFMYLDEDSGFLYKKKDSKKNMTRIVSTLTNIKEQIGITYMMIEQILLENFVIGDEELDEEFDTFEDDYNKFEEKDIEGSENTQYMFEFSNYLEREFLSERVINKHLNKLSFLVEQFMCEIEEYNIIDFDEAIEDYLGYTYPKKCMWSTPNDLKDLLASIRKFAKYLLEYGYIDETKYKRIVSSTKENHMYWESLIL